MAAKIKKNLLRKRHFTEKTSQTTGYFTKKSGETHLCIDFFCTFAQKYIMHAQATAKACWVNKETINIVTILANEILSHHRTLWDSMGNNNDHYRSDCPYCGNKLQVFTYREYHPEVDEPMQFEERAEMCCPNCDFN